MGTRSSVRVAVRIAVLAVASGGVPSARAEWWTNAAGHAIEAKWVDGDGQTVVLERPNGARISLPLLSLSPGARQRAEQLLADATPSESKSDPADSADPVAARARALYDAGKISAEELQSTLNSLPPAVR